MRLNLNILLFMNYYYRHGGNGLSLLVQQNEVQSFLFPKEMKKIMQEKSIYKPGSIRKVKITTTNIAKNNIYFFITE